MSSEYDIDITMLDEDTQKMIIDFISSEARVVNFGKLKIEMTVLNGHATNIQIETIKNRNINQQNAQSKTLAHR